MSKLREEFKKQQESRFTGQNYYLRQAIKNTLTGWNKK